MTEVVLVTGDRDWTDWELLYSVLDQADPDILIEGEARGADKWSRNWAESRGFSPLEPNFHNGVYVPHSSITGKVFFPMPADWKRFKRAAGPIRNGQMATLLKFFADAMYDCEVYAFHNDIENSKGTKDMVGRVKKLEIMIHLIMSFNKSEEDPRV